MFRTADLSFRPRTRAGRLGAGAAAALAAAAGILVGAGLPVATAGASALIPMPYPTFPANPPGPGGCRSQVVVDSTWSSGFLATVRITPTGAALASWQVKVSMADGSQIVNVWNGKYNGTLVSSTPWNGRIEAGRWGGFGFQGNGSPAGITTSCWGVPATPPTAPTAEPTGPVESVPGYPSNAPTNPGYPPPTGGACPPLVTSTPTAVPTSPPSPPSSTSATIPSRPRVPVTLHGNEFVVKPVLTCAPVPPATSTHVPPRVH